jgi:hypothetical protein
VHSCLLRTMIFLPMTSHIAGAAYVSHYAQPLLYFKKSFLFLFLPLPNFIYIFSFRFLGFFFFAALEFEPRASHLLRQALCLPLELLHQPLVIRFLNLLFSSSHSLPFSSFNFASFFPFLVPLLHLFIITFASINF